MLTKALFNHAFDNNYKSIVVLANPKTILNAKRAKKEIKNQVIRADQLSEFIRKTDADPNAITSSEKEIEALARYFLGIHKPVNIDYTAKFREMLVADDRKNESMITSVENKQILCPKCGAIMILRKATKGANAGKAFYGCSNFPKCRGIVQIS